MPTDAGRHPSKRGSSVASTSDIAPLPLSSRGRFTLLAVACLTIMVGTAVAPGLTVISSALGVSGHASWLVTLPALGVMIFAPLAGRLIDHVGPYTALLWGLASYGVLGAGGILLEGPVPVFADRVLLGAATAVVMTSGTSLISHWYHGQERLRMLAQQGMAIELGGVVFLLVSGGLAAIEWYWPFALYLLAWLMALMVRVWVPERSPAGEQASEAAGRASGAGMGLVYVAAVAAMMLFFTSIVLLPVELKAMGMGETGIGVFLAAISLVAVVAAMLMPRVAGRIGEGLILVLAFAGYTVSLALFGWTQSLWLMSLGVLFAGSAFGFSIPLVNHMTVERTPAAQRGRRLAYLSMAIFSGQFLTSLLEFVPGQASSIFGLMAVVGGLFVVIYLQAWRRERGQVRRWARG